MPVPIGPRVTSKFHYPTLVQVLGFISHEAPSGVIFVHGAGGNSLLWKRMLNYLSGPSFALAADLPGHPTGEITCKTVGEYAEAVFEFIADREIDRPGGLRPLYGRRNRNLAGVVQSFLADVTL